MNKAKVIVLVLLMMFGTLFVGCGNEATTAETIDTMNQEIDMFIGGAEGAILDGEYGIMEDNKTPYFVFVLDDAWLYADDAMLLETGEIFYDYCKDAMKRNHISGDFGLVIGDNYGNAYVIYVPGSDAPQLQ